MSRVVPVIVGVAQLANKDDDRIVAPLPLLAEAVAHACDDSEAAVGPLVDGVFVAPPTVFDRADPAVALAALIGARAGERTVARFSGAGPTRLLAAACEAIVAGRVEVAVVGGAVAEASIKRARRRGVEPVALPASGWSQGSAGPGDVPERNDRFDSAVPEMAAGVGGPSEIFALIESAIAGRAGRSVDAQRAWLGAVMAPFTAVAATRPDVAWFPRARTAAELSEVRPDNRMIAEPYPKLMNSFPIVDLAAAIVVTSEATADRLGVPRAKRVYPQALALAKDPAPPSRRADVGRSVALDRAVERALTPLALGPDDMACFDLYSCFPAAVQMATAALGLDVFDPRGLTTTGGLPYFGGPGASYNVHAIVSTVERCRTRGFGLTVGLGGFAGDFGVGVFHAAEPARPLVIDHGADTEAELRVGPVDDPGREGEATVLAKTVVHDHDGPRHAPLVARFDDGVVVGAQAPSRAAAADLVGVPLVGRRVRIVRDGERSTYRVF